MKVSKILIILSLIIISKAKAGGWQTFTDYNQISSIFSYGERLYFGSLGAIIEMKSTGDISVYNNLNGIMALEIKSIKADSLGRIWYAGTKGGFGYIKNGEIQSFSDFIVSGVDIYDIYIFGNEIWTATTKGVSLFIYRPNINSGEIKESYFKLGTFPAETPANAICIIGDSVFVGTDKGLALAHRDYKKYNLTNPQSWKTIEMEVSVKGIGVYNNEILVLTSGGIYKYENGDVQNIGLSNYSLNRHINFNDTLFVSGNSGVFKKRGQGFVRVNVVNLPHQASSGLAIFDNKLYSAHEKGYSIYENGKLVGHRFNAPMGRFFVSFTKDESDRIWAAGRNWSLSVYNAGVWQCGTSLPFEFSSFNDLYYFPDTIIRAYTLEVDKRGKVWCGTWGNGLFVLRWLDDYVHLTSTNSPLEPAVGPSYIVISAIETDQYGNVWVANYSAPRVGLIVYKNGDLESTPVVFELTSAGLNSNLINSLESSGDRVWIGLRDGGLIELDTRGTLDNQGDDIWKYYTTANGLQTNTVKALCISHDDKLYIGTDGGLAKLEPSTGIIEQIVLPETFSLNITALACDRYNNIWIGSTNGVAVFFPSKGKFETLYSKNDINAPPQARTGLLSNTVFAIYVNRATNDVWFGVDGGMSVLKGSTQGENELGMVKVYPNPFKLVYGGTSRLIISGVPMNARVRILTVSGNLVREFPDGASGYTMEIAWDGTNQNGKIISSGVYIAEILSPKGEKRIVKFAVIR